MQVLQLPHTTCEAGGLIFTVLAWRISWDKQQQKPEKTLLQQETLKGLNLRKRTRLSSVHGSLYWLPGKTGKQEILLQYLHILRQFLNSMLLILFEYRHFHLIWDENKYLERKSNVLWSREKLKRLDLHLCERLRLKNLYAVSQVHKYVHFQLFL